MSEHSAIRLERTAAVREFSLALRIRKCRFVQPGCTNWLHKPLRSRLCTPSAQLMNRKEPSSRTVSDQPRVREIGRSATELKKQWLRVGYRACSLHLLQPQFGFPLRSPWPVALTCWPL